MNNPFLNIDFLRYADYLYNLYNDQILYYLMFDKLTTSQQITIKKYNYKIINEQHNKKSNIIKKAT